MDFQAKDRSGLDLDKERREHRKKVLSTASIASVGVILLSFAVSMFTDKPEEQPKQKETNNIQIETNNLPQALIPSNYEDDIKNDQVIPQNNESSHHKELQNNTQQNDPFAEFKNADDNSSLLDSNEPKQNELPFDNSLLEDSSNIKEYNNENANSSSNETLDIISQIEQDNNEDEYDEDAEFNNFIESDSSNTNTAIDNSIYVIQCEQFNTEQEANSAKATLAFQGIIASIVNNQGLYTLEIGSFNNKNTALSKIKELTNTGLLKECHIINK